jgi:hypothetical protein
MMGLPVLKDMDGRVLKELFQEEGEPAQREVKYQQVDTERERLKARIMRLKDSGRM